LAESSLPPPEPPQRAGEPQSRFAIGCRVEGIGCRVRPRRDGLQGGRRLFWRVRPRALHPEPWTLPERPAERGAQVLVLWFEDRQPLELLRPFQVRRRPLRLPQEVAEVATAHLSCLTALEEPVASILPHRLQQAVAGC